MNVKWSDSDSRSVWTLGVHELLVGLDAFHIAEFREPVKKQTVATPHVEDTQARVPPEVPAHHP